MDCPCQTRFCHDQPIASKISFSCFHHNTIPYHVRKCLQLNGSVGNGIEIQFLRKNVSNEADPTKNVFLMPNLEVFRRCMLQAIRNSCGETT